MWRVVYIVVRQQYGNMADELANRLSSLADSLRSRGMPPPQSSVHLKRYKDYFLALEGGIQGFQGLGIRDQFLRLLAVLILIVMAHVGNASSHTQKERAKQRIQEERAKQHLRLY